MVGKVVTVGVYGFTADGFLGALESAGVAVLIDVRQRRGVRGSEYAWANSQRLQAALADADMAYLHLKELAPTTEIRAAQYTADAAAGEGKRSRSELSDAFRRAYSDQILDAVDLEAALAAIPDPATAALLCVEREPRACHRSLIADRLAAKHGVEVSHLVP